jgi:integrase
MSKKGENIYKRKDGRWEARYIKGYAPDGSIRYGYCYAASYREAKGKAGAAKADLLNSGVASPTAEKRRFGAYCDEWLQINRSGIKESTYVKYLSMLEKHILPCFGGCRPQALTGLMVESFSRDLLDDGLSPKTVRDILAVLQSILRYMKKEVNIMPPIEVIFPKTQKKEMRVLTREEQVRFTEYLLSNMDECKFGVLLALLTGLRIGEICALKWKNISLQDGCLTVSSTMQRMRDVNERTQQKTKIVISDPKSETSVRKIPLTEYALEICSRWQTDGEAFILTGGCKHYLEPRTLQYRLEKYTTDCGLDGVHFHVLRHTFATRCVEVGFEIKSLSEILGHTSPKFTLERYVHSSMELKRDNMAKLAAIGY